MIHRSTKEQKRKVMNTLLLGLSMDPLFRWYFPEPDEFLSNAPALLDLISGKAFEHNTVYHTENFTCCALWLPPDVHPDDDGISRYLEEKLEGPRLKEVSALEAEMSKSIPKEACWHLSLIVADPAQTGKGHGSKLLDHTLRLIDEDKKPAYLESTNRANLTLYERYGFDLINEIQIGNSPTIYSMIRQPGES